MTEKRPDTSDGIAAADWDSIHQIALKIANASLTDDDATMVAEYAAMHEALDELILKYGDKPPLWSTKADYQNDPVESISLYQKAYVLAEQTDSHKNKTMIAWSLAELYWDYLGDWYNTEIWLDKLKACLEGYPDDYASEMYVSPRRGLFTVVEND